MSDQSHLHLGPFSVDDKGRLQPTDPGATPSFTVRWRGRRISARMARPPGNASECPWSLSLQVILGRVPSTAGSDTATRSMQRNEVFGLVRRLTPVLPKAWHLALLPDHCIGLTFRDALAMPTTVSSLLSALTSFLLQLDPYLEMLDTVGSGVEAA